jgi:hypothetical protein
VPAEPLEADHRGRPRTEPSLATQPRRRGGGRHGSQPLELVVLAQPRERRAAPRVDAERAQLRRGERAQRPSRRRCAEAAATARRSANDPTLDLLRAPPVDQLPAERAEQRVLDRRDAQLAEPAEHDDGAPEQRVAPKPA